MLRGIRITGSTKRERERGRAPISPKYGTDKNNTEKVYNAVKSVHETRENQQFVPQFGCNHHKVASANQSLDFCHVIFPSRSRIHGGSRNSSWRQYVQERNHIQQPATAAAAVAPTASKLCCMHTLHVWHMFRCASQPSRRSSSTSHTSLKQGPTHLERWIARGGDRERTTCVCVDRSALRCCWLVLGGLGAS